MTDPRMHHDNPERDKLVWESADGPILVTDMDREHLRNAIEFVKREGFKSEALPAMRNRLRHLDIESLCACGHSRGNHFLKPGWPACSKCGTCKEYVDG